MTSSKALFYFCLAFIFGVTLQSFLFVSQLLIWVFLFFAVSILVMYFFIEQKFSLGVLAFCCFFFVLGILRMQVVEFKNTNDDLILFNDSTEKITLTGRIVFEPEIRDTSQKLKVKVKDSLILVTVGRYPEYHYLDEIKMIGKLKTPMIFDDFNYQRYLAKEGIYSVMDFPKIEKISSSTGKNILEFVYKKLLTIKKNLINTIAHNFFPPENFIMQGIIFGDDKNTPSDLKDKFNVTGLSHLTAVSGSNIVIIIEIILFFFLALGLWRQQALLVAIFLIWLYIVLIGFPVSAIRAAIMGSILLISQVFGRQNQVTRVLLLAGALMLWHNPLLLRDDIGFQLSFLASLGIIYVKPLIDGVILPILKEKFIFWVDIISITLAAQILTLPIIILNFGRFSLVSPLTNVLILPIIPALTILGLFVALIGFFLPTLGFLFSLPCRVLLFYFLKVIDVFYQPWASKAIENISWIWVIVYYAVAVFIIWYFQQKQKSNFLEF